MGSAMGCAAKSPPSAPVNGVHGRGSSKAEEAHVSAVGGSIPDAPHQAATDAASLDDVDVLSELRDPSGVVRLSASGKTADILIDAGYQLMGGKLCFLIASTVPALMLFCLNLQKRSHPLRSSRQQRPSQPYTRNGQLRRYAQESPAAVLPLVSTHKPVIGLAGGECPSVRLLNGSLRPCMEVLRLRASWGPCAQPPPTLPTASPSPCGRSLARGVGASPFCHPSGGLARGRGAE